MNRSEYKDFYDKQGFGIDEGILKDKYLSELAEANWTL